MNNRKDEIAAKKARLAELKRQRELRRDEFSRGRQSIRDASDLVASSSSRPDNRKELDSLISSLVGGSSSRRESATPTKGSRPNSVLGAEGAGLDNGGTTSTSATPRADPQSSIATASTQTLSSAPIATVFEYVPSPVKEVYTYSKGVQTSEAWSPPRRRRSAGNFFGSEDELSPTRHRPGRNNKRLSKREREIDEEIRANIRREVEEELKALQETQLNGQHDPSSDGTRARQNFPGRPLTERELEAVVSSNDFLDFMERSSKVIERALDEEYDVLADYAMGAVRDDDEEEEVYGGIRRKSKRRIREVAQFWDEKWSKKRMITSLDFSPKFPELVLSAYTKNIVAPQEPDGIVQVSNLHLHDRPEYVFHAQSDLLVAKFSPFHPNLIIAGAYSGQVLIWDTRAKATPVQKTPLTGSGHTHPVYDIDIVGTQNANNIISCSTDGVVCGWTVDMLAQPQEFLELTTPPPAKTEDMSPTCMAFPRADPTYFVVGTEEGGIYPCHRYDRAGAKAGVDQRASYRGHAAPVTSVNFHPARGVVDLGDLVLSSSMDWSVKLWRVRAPAATSTGPVSGPAQEAQPLLEFVREDVVYDAAWSPVKPGIFSLVDGAGHVEVWDLTTDTEVPVARAQPSRRKGVSLQANSLNRVTWEGHEGKKMAVGGLDGVVTVFEVGSELGGLDSARAEEWASMKKLVTRLDGAMAGNRVSGAQGNRP